MSTSKPGLFRLASYLIGRKPEPKRQTRLVKTYVLTGNVPPRFTLIIPATITREQHR